jgi:hypothetical protein
MSSIAVRYIDLLTGVVNSETMRLRELHLFLEDENNGEIQILEIDQSFDGWETMEVIFQLGQ